MTEDMHEERLQAVEAFGDSLVSSTYFPTEMNMIWLSAKNMNISIGVMFLNKCVDVLPHYICSCVLCRP